MRHRLSSFISHNSAIKPADLMFVDGAGWLSNLIGKVTGGRMSHVALVLDKEHLLETEGNIGKSRISPIGNYFGSDITFLRYKGLQTHHIESFRRLCLQHTGIPYSYWDCFQNLVLRPLPRKWRRKVLAWTGGHRFMKCDELVQHVMFELTKDPVFGMEEQLNPEELYDRCRASKKFWKVDLLSGIVDR